MKTNKIWKKLLMAGALLGLLLTSACSLGSSINTPEEKALAAQGDAMMAVIKAGDLQAIYEELSREDQQLLNGAIDLASSVVDVERLVQENAPKITTWEFDRARIYSKDGATRGKLDGKAEYVDGTTGHVHLELAQQGGDWKLSGWTLEKGWTLAKPYTWKLQHTVEK